MINPATAEALALDHQHELRRSADRRRLAAQARSGRAQRVRARAGWLLVHAGIRLALSADTGHAAASTNGRTSDGHAIGATT